MKGLISVEKYPDGVVAEIAAPDSLIGVEKHSNGVVEDLGAACWKLPAPD